MPEPEVLPGGWGHSTVGRAARRVGLPAAWPLVVFGGFTVVFAVLYAAQAFFIPIALAVLLAFLLAPIDAFLQKYGLGRVLSAILVCLFALLVLGGVGYVIVTQVAEIGNELPQYRHNIRQKVMDIRWLRRGSSIAKVQETMKGAVEEAAKTDPGKPAPRPPMPVVIEERPENRIWSNLTAVRPWLEPLGTTALVLLLVPFMLLERHDIRNRVIQLVGYSKMAITTKALDEAGQRVSRYLLMQGIVNTTFGGAAAVGLFLVGVPYALLFGFIAAVMRFIPYVGPWLGALFPVMLSLAVFPGWTKPVMVLAVFLVIEVLCSMVLEPLLYSNSAGVSQVALLIALAFWTFLWGPIGLMLATPLTVCLVVFAKYVPDLKFITVLMTDEQPLPPSAAYYQRLLAEDDDAATAVVEEFLKTHPAEGMYDEVLVPALTLARRDRARGHLSIEEEGFVVSGTREILERLEDHTLRAAAARDEGRSPDASPVPSLRVLACPARDEADEVVLMMFRALLEGTRAEVEMVSSVALSSEVVSLAADTTPGVVLVAALPPGGLTQSRYLCKRLRARFPDLPIVVGRWCAEDNAEEVRALLSAAGATDVGFTLLDTRRLVLQYSQVRAEREPTAVA